MANLTGYYDEQNNDLYYKYNTDSSNNTIVSSGLTGIYVSVQSTNSGPLLLKTNTSNVIVRTDLSGGIAFKPNGTTSLQIGFTGMQFSPQGVTTFWNDMINGNMYCYNQWLYGIRVINNNTSNQTYTLSLTDPRNIFFIGTNGCTLTFPTNPPNGTEYFIRKITGVYNITVTNIATREALRSNNTVQTTFATSSKNSGVVYSSSRNCWVCFNIGT
jgi:hypothetical protein